MARVKRLTEKRQALDVGAKRVAPEKNVDGKKRKVATDKKVVAKAATSQRSAAKRPIKKKMTRKNTIKAGAGSKGTAGKTKVANKKKAAGKTTAPTSDTKGEKASPRIAKAKSVAHSPDPLRSLLRKAALRRLTTRVG